MTVQTPAKPAQKVARKAKTNGAPKQEAPKAPANSTAAGTIDHRVRVTLTVVVKGGTAPWNKEFATDEAPREITAAIKAAATEAVRNQFSHIPAISIEEA